MKDFLEKWNTDKKYQTKIKLSLYTAFVVIVSIIAISNRTPITQNETEINDESNNISNEFTENKQIDLIKIPPKYDYKIEIKINENKYLYKGTRINNQETITKETNDTVINYIYENGLYYKQVESNYILTEEEEIYDIIDKSYLEIETINQYLSIATKMLNQHIVYLKYITLGDNSEEYIIIELNKNITNIDYTALMHKFNKHINQYLVKIEIKEIE